MSGETRVDFNRVDLDQAQISC